MVEWHVGRAQQGADGVDQHICGSTGLTLGHCGVQPLAGNAVNPPVMAAEVALGLTQRGLTLQRLHRCQLGGQRGGVLADAQQRAVVAQRGLQLGGPLRLGGVGLAGPGLGTGLHGLALLGLGGGGGLDWPCFGRSRHSGHRRLGAA